jgi:thioredoxin 1
MMSEREEIRQRKAEALQERLADDGDDAEAATDAPDRSEPIHVTSGDHLQELIDEGGVVLADFYADWCGPCKMLEPIVEEIAAETTATVAKVDVDQHQRLAQQYRVQGVPTMYLFAGGETVEQMVGVRDKDQLVSLIQRHS